MTSQITITEQPPQQNTFNFHRNSQDQQQNGMSPYPMPIAQHQQPQQLHPKQQFLQPQQQLSPNLMQVPVKDEFEQKVTIFYNVEILIKNWTIITIVSFFMR